MTASSPTPNSDPSSRSADNRANPENPPRAASEVAQGPPPGHAPRAGSGVGSGNPRSAKNVIGQLQQEMNRLQREIRLAIQAQLGQISGQSLDTIEENRELARAIQEMLDAHGLRVRCSQCGHAAILRVSPRSGAAAGVFVFDHTVDGRRTFHGGRITIPEIRLVAKPARKPPTRSGDGAKGKQSSNRAAG